MEEIQCGIEEKGKRKKEKGERLRKILFLAPRASFLVPVSSIEFAMG